MGPSSEWHDIKFDISTESHEHKPLSSGVAFIDWRLRTYQCKAPPPPSRA